MCLSVSHFSSPASVLVFLLMPPLFTVVCNIQNFADYKAQPLLVALTSPGLTVASKMLADTEMLHIDSDTISYDTRQLSRSVHFGKCCLCQPPVVPLPPQGDCF